MNILKIATKIIPTGRTLLRSTFEPITRLEGGAVVQSSRKIFTDTFEHSGASVLDSGIRKSKQLLELEKLTTKPLITEAISRDFLFEASSIDELRKGINGIKINSTKAGNLRYKGYARISNPDNLVEITKNGNKFNVFVKYNDTVNPDTICTKEELDSVMNYVFQRRFRVMNEGLEGLYRGETIDAGLFEEIKHVASTIRKFGKLDGVTNVHRWETSLWSLENLQTKFGKDLTKKMYEVIQKYEKFNTLSSQEQKELAKLKDAIISEINSAPKSEIIQPHFMSTTYSTNLPQIDRNNAIRYDLKIDKDVKGLDMLSFLKDDLELPYQYGVLQRDRELLLQHGAKMKHGKISFDMDSKIWVMDTNITI